MKRVAKAAAPDYTDPRDADPRDARGKGDAAEAESDGQRAQRELSALRSTLTKALLFPSLVIIRASGRGGTLVLSLGGMVCYILDLFQWMEGTIVALSLTLAAFAGSLLWSVSGRLAESPMNLPLVPICGMTLLFVFLNALSHFHYIGQHFHALLFLAHQLIVCSLPLVASTILSVSLCEENSALDLPSTFTVLYAFHCFWLCQPRVMYLPDVTKAAPRAGGVAVYMRRALLPHGLVTVVHAVPVLASVLLHLALHHNTLGLSRSALSSLLQSVFLPILLMMMTYKRHYAISWSPLWDRGLAFVGVCYAAAIVDHPAFDDLRRFGGFPEPIPTYLLTGLLLFAMLAVFFIRRLQSFGRDPADLDSRGYMLARIGSAMTNALATGLLCLLIGMPAIVLPFCIFGSLAMSELFFHRHVPARQLVLALLSSAAMLLVVPEFFKSTIYYIGFNFAWHVDLTMPQFCNTLIVLTIFYAIVPVVLDPNGKAADLLPMGHQHQRPERAHGALVFFSLVLILLGTATAALELMVLEQHWDSLNLRTEDVYPAYFFCITTAIFMFLTFKLHQRMIIGASTTLIVWAVQSGKLLHFLSVPSATIFSLIFVLLCSVLPFTRQLSEYLGRDDSEVFMEADTSGASVASYVSLTHVEIGGFVAAHSLVSVYAGRSVAQFVLTAALGKAASSLQTLLFAGAIWSLFMSTILLVFFRRARLLRSAAFALAVMLMIVAFEGFGALSFSSENLLAQTDDHSFIFMLLSSAMTVVAWTKTIPLVDATSCLVYSVLFGFASTKAMLSWALPIYPGVAQLTHHVTHFPFLALYVGKAGSTFIVLWSSKDKFRTKLFALVFLCAVLWPFVALGIAKTAGYPPALQHGLMWSSIVSTASTCFSFRAQEVLALMRGSRSTHALPSRYGELSMILMLAVLCLIWTVLAIFHQISSLDADVFFPVVALLLLCEDASFLPYKQHPVQAWVAVSTVWWYGSALYHVFLRGLDDPAVLEGLPPHSLFGWDEEVSIWVAETPYLSIVNAGLAVLPLPAIYASLAKVKGVSAEMLFIMALVCVAAVVGGSLDCVRYLGIVGAAVAGHRCYALSSSQKARLDVI